MITRAECEVAALAAIYKANKRYAQWSKNSWLNDAGVEPVICHAIAEELTSHSKWGSWSLELEVPFRTIVEYAGAPTRLGRPPSLLRGGARADVVVFDGRGRPRYVIEVKRSWSNTGAMTDGLRLCTILERCGKASGGSVDAGLMAIFTVRSPRAKRDAATIEARHRNLLKELAPWGFRTDYKQGDLELYEFEDGEWGCQGLCCSFY